ncbi:hypothetical protein H671_8g19596 [Cricetulus griseus]|nr:hypothetical protein H671_8g19596 [Cricetulus griseus]
MFSLFHHINLDLFVKNQVFIDSKFLLYRSFTFLFVYIVYYIDGFSYVEPSLHPWDETYLIIVDDFSDVFLDLIRQYFVEYFCIDVHEGYWSVVLFLSHIFVWLGYQNLALAAKYRNQILCKSDAEV